MRVAFVFNGFGLRGVELNMYGYALYNETLLGNASVIICQTGIRPVSEDTPPAAKRLFTDRFETYEVSTESMDASLVRLKIDVCVLGVSGGANSYIPRSCPTISHCVFRCEIPLGSTLHVAISNTVSMGRVPVLPNVICMDHHDRDLRDELGIPAGATVFGRYGGWETFDVPGVHETVLRVARERPGVYFIFMHTKPFGSAPNVLYLEGSTDFARKRSFINTCDAMLHARKDGETFGLACGEFALAGKAVITSDLGDGEHRRILGDKAIVYRDMSELDAVLRGPAPAGVTGTGYDAYRPERVMVALRTALAQCLWLACGATGLSDHYDDGR